MKRYQKIFKEAIVSKIRTYSDKIDVYSNNDILFTLISKNGEVYLQGEDLFSYFYTSQKMRLVSKKLDIDEMVVIDWLGNKKRLEIEFASNRENITIEIKQFPEFFEFPCSVSFSE